jgi:tRNA G18 (ribose-2'-O)-methylase SpoU
MAVFEITDPDDPRIAAYRDIRERDLTGRQGLFVAEGSVVVRTLVSAASLARPHSLLLALNRAAGLADVIERVGGAAPVYLADQPVLDAVAGFPLHRGVLALGDKPPERNIEALLAEAEPSLVLACSGIGNHDNMGALFRNAAGFGAAVVLDERCCDPFYRKAIRVSTGAVLRTPQARGGSAGQVADVLAAAGYEVLALSPAGAERLADVRPGGRMALLVGSEGPGLPPEVITRCRSVAIPMAADFDSLNVATAAAIALHQLATDR